MNPKYNIADKVWRVVNQKCVEEEISGIQATAGDYTGDGFEYSVSIPRTNLYLGGFREIKHVYFNESELFPSKEDLLEYLAK